MRVQRAKFEILVISIIGKYKNLPCE